MVVAGRVCGVVAGMPAWWWSWSAMRRLIVACPGVPDGVTGGGGWYVHSGWPETA